MKSKLVKFYKYIAKPGYFGVRIKTVWTNAKASQIYLCWTSKGKNVLLTIMRSRISRAFDPTCPTKNSYVEIWIKYHLSNTVTYNSFQHSCISCVLNNEEYFLFWLLILTFIILVQRLKLRYYVFNFWLRW